MELKKYRLGDIAKVVNGSTPSTLHPEYYDGDVVWITPKDLSEQKSKYIQKGERNITTEGYNSCSTQMIPANNILLTSRAPIGLVAINSVECCTNQGFKNIIVDNSKADVDYLYYYIKYHIKEIEILGAGTTFKEVSKNALEKYIISIPSLSSQRKIAGVLSALDQKIALNRTINQSLEQLAKTIYTYYFLQFHNAKALTYNPTLKKMLPTGWEYITTDKLTNVVTGKEDANFSTPNGAYPFFTCSKENLQCDKAAFSGKAILIAGNGDFNVKHYTGEFNAYQRTYVLIPKDPKYYGVLYFAALDKIASFRAKSNGSIIKFITKGDIENIGIFECHQPEIYEQLNTLLDKIEINDKEITALTTYRDALLPVLMNGQVEVE